MGQFVKSSKKVLVWNKPEIHYYNKEHFSEDEEIVVTELPAGKIIEIYSSGKGDFKFSSDSKTEGREDSQVSKYLQKYIYNKLTIINEKLFSLPIHFYGFIGKKGFQGIDIFINENYLDWDLTKKFFNEVKIKIPEEIFTGLSQDIELDLLDSFIVRTTMEYPDNRSIFYKRKKS